MRTAKKVVVSVELSCPECNETIVEPNSGSMYWQVCELPAPGTPLTCFHCGAKSKAPKA